MNYELLANYLLDTGPPISRGQAFAGMTMLTAFNDYDTISGGGHEAVSFAFY